jgi:AhpD family alkylhydroperoxidase
MKRRKEESFSQGGECYDKPIWTLTDLAGVLPTMPLHLVRTFPTLFNFPISGRFRERIMLAVAAENRCWYCQTAHSALGRALGLTRDEIEAVLAGHDRDMNEDEALALAYARDLARRGFTSRSQSLRRDLLERFSPVQVRAIESTAHVMNLANRFGNTFDAARTRITGGCDKTGAGILDLAALSAGFLWGASLAGPVVAAIMIYNRILGDR